MEKFNIRDSGEKDEIGIAGEAIGDFKFDCLNIFSKEYAILHAASEGGRGSKFIGRWTEY